MNWDEYFINIAEQVKLKSKRYQNSNWSGYSW